MDFSVSAPSLISSESDLRSFLACADTPCTLYIDLEGNNLSRHGTISLLVVLIEPQHQVGVIDVLTLGNAAFTTASSDGKTLKSVLEDPSIEKCIWDARNDSDALWAHHGIDLTNVMDVQLLENASRPDTKIFLRGLDVCIRFDLQSQVSPAEIARFAQTKSELKSLMPTDVFSKRPLDQKTIEYCVNDVLYLPDLRRFYMSRLQGDWLQKVKDESASRVAFAHDPAYNPESPSNKFGPWGYGT